MTPRPAVLLVTSNGAGMGHLARLTAVATALGDRAEPVLLSMSSALPTVTAATGLRGEYVPGPRRGWMPPEPWHDYVRQRIALLAREVDARLVLFDGVAPYRGLLRARADLPGVPFLWSRRGMWKPDVNRRALRGSRWFDVVVEPGDLASSVDAGATAGRSDVVRVPPVTLLSTTPALSRDAARDALGLDGDGPTLLVTLGAGNLDDTGEPTSQVVRTARDAGWQVALTHAPIAEHDRTPEGVAVLRRLFPLVAYRAGVDAVVAAGGYNSVHEFVCAGMPTLLVPNAAAATDDQKRRTDYVARRGWALEADPSDGAALRAATTRLLDPGTRADLAAATADLPPADGAQRLADLVVATMAGRSSWRAPAIDVDAALAAGLGAGRRLLGEHRWEALRRRAGRPPRPPVSGPLDLAFDGTGADGAVLLTDDDAAVTPAPRPVLEHLVANASDDYRERRLALLRATYRVRD